MLDSNDQSSNSRRQQLPTWRQSIVSLCSSVSRQSGGNLHHRLGRNVHLKKGSTSRLHLYQQLLQHHSTSSDGHYHRKSSALATFQARLCLGTEYLPVYELNCDYQQRPRPVTSTTNAASSSSSATSSTLSRQQQIKQNKLKKKKRKLNTLERMVKMKKMKKESAAIKRLTFLRLTSRGIVFSDLPSIKLVNDELESFSPFRSSSSGTLKPTVQRTPSVQKAIIAWADLDHIWLEKLRMDLHLKTHQQLQSLEKEVKQESGVLHLQFAASRDVHAFITAGLAYGYFCSKDLVFSSPSSSATGDDDIENRNTSSSQPCTSTSASAPGTVKEHLTAQLSTNKRNLLATLWRKLKSSKGKADISSTTTSSTSTLSSAADVVSANFPDSTTEKEGKKSKDKDNNFLRRHLSSACVHWASQKFRSGGGRRRR